MRPIRELDLDLIMVSAFRYALPRKTYITSVVAEYIIANIDILDDFSREQMASEIEERIPELSTVDLPIWLELLHALRTQEDIT